MTRINLSAHRRNITMNVEESDLIGRVILRGRRFYEQDLLEDAYQRLRLRPTGFVMDVGAHIGNHSLWFAGVCRRPTVAVEPNPAAAERLRQHVRLNQLDVEMYQLALGAEAATARLEPGPAHNSGMARVVADPEGRDVDICTLDSLMEAVRFFNPERRMAMLKIDVEGSAVDVLRGGAETLARDRPIIYAEADREGLQDHLGDDWKCFGKFGRTPTWGFLHADS